MLNHLKLESFDRSKAELEKALKEANFLIFLPDKLTKNFKITEISFRSENSNNLYPRSSFKFIVEENVTKKKLSIKQFNYDWAPPAYDCPSLWWNYKEFGNLNTQEPHCLLLNDDLLWIGSNYRNQNAASIFKERTCIELVFLEEKFNDSEIFNIVSNLKPFDELQYKEILSKSLAELSYGYPRAVKAVNVPISFWSFPVGKSKIKFQTAYNQDAIPDFAKKFHIPLPDNIGYKLSAVFSYHEEEKPSQGSRHNFVYEHENCKGQIIQIIHMPKSSPAACAFPPEPDATQKFKTTTKKIHGLECYYAYRSEDYGPHELVFEYKNMIYLISIRPARWTNQKWFFNLLDNFLSEENLRYVLTSNHG